MRHFLGDIQLCGAFDLHLFGRRGWTGLLGDLSVVVELVLLLQCTGDVKGSGIVIRLQHVPEIAPVLLPHVAHQVCRQHAAGDFALVLAVLRIELGARIAMQLRVQRLHLAPQAVGFSGEFRRWHVVTRPPDFAGIGKAHVSSTFVEKIDEADVILANRFCDRVPPIPCVELGVVVAAAAKHVFEIPELLAAGLVAGRPAVFAGTVRAFHPAGDASEFRQVLRIARGRHRRHRFQQHDRTRGSRRHLAAFKLPLLLDPAIELCQPALVGLGREHLAVVGDVGRGDPLRGAEFGVAVAELVVDACDELISGFVGRYSLGGRSRL
jgi:hypothetical protein